jgi:S1-C subfamily serine protease
VHRPSARRARRLAGALIALAACADAGPRRADPAVVAVAAQPCRRPTSDIGTGVVVGPGLVLTAAHVVDGRRRTIAVDGRPAHVLALDPRTDLALLTAPVTGPGVELAAPSGPEARVGSRDVEIIGTERLVVHDATTGHVHRREVHTLRPMVAPGTSGAPLVDDRRRVLGVVVLDNRTDGTAYAVTAAEIRRFLAARPNSAAPAGCVDEGMSSRSGGRAPLRSGGGEFGRRSRSGFAGRRSPSD